MIDACPACNPCITALNRGAGEFKYPSGAELIGLLSCGGCPGSSVLAKLNAFNRWIAGAPPGFGLEQPTKIHVANCIKDNCPYAEDIIAKIASKALIDPATQKTIVKERTHAYGPPDHSIGKHHKT